jgi:phage tail protein X
LINKKNKLLKKSAYVEMDGFVFTGFPDASTGLPDASTELPDASTGLPDASTGLPDASTVEFPDGSVEPENMLPKIPDPDVFPDGSVVVFPDGSEENGDERLNASLFDENNALIGVAPFKNDFIVILFQ